MCKITDYQYDEAILAIRPHAPKAAQIIEQYVEQLRREKAETREYIKDAIKLISMNFINSARGELFSLLEKKG